MHRQRALAALLCAGLAGCAAPKAPALDYLPPSGAPAAHRSALVEQPPWLVLGNIVDRLQQRGLPVTELDEAAGELVVAYSGDPEPYVDCGWIVTYERCRPLPHRRAFLGGTTGISSTSSATSGSTPG
jgi:hypothetical protein